MKGVSSVAHAIRASGFQPVVSLTACLVAVLAAMTACKSDKPKAKVADVTVHLTIDDENDRSSARFERYAVAADHAQASEAGAEMLALGGNAVDAAVATSFALSVVRPESCGIGGGGFMVVHLAGGPRRAGAAPLEYPLNIVIDYRERAPASASPDMFANLPPDASQWSGASVAVPGTVAGLLHALEKYGTLDRATVLAPAIRLAKEGYDFDRHAERSAQALAKFLTDHPDRADEGTALMRRLFLAWPWPDPRTGEQAQGPEHIGVCDGFRVPPQPDAVPPQDDAVPTGGQVARQRWGEASEHDNPRQALVLEAIARDGSDGFYKGHVAQAIVRSVSAFGGGLSLDDLARVRVREAAPLIGTWRGKTILTMPLPSSGGVTLLQVLGLMERTRPQWASSFGNWRERMKVFEEKPTAGKTPEPVLGTPYLHCLTESFKHAFADRAQYLGDPAFMTADPTPRLLDAARLDAKARTIDPKRTRPGAHYADTAQLNDLLSGNATPPDDHGTSHFSVVDRWGNAVACTETLNLAFGSCIMVPEYGFCLNNQMDDFQTRRGEANAFGLVQSERNLPEAGKCPLSSMTPTIVLDAGGKVETVVGASGGPRIITATVQALLLADEPEFGVMLAFQMPRIHHQWKPDTLMAEPAYLAFVSRFEGTMGEWLFGDVAQLRTRGDAVLDRDPCLDVKALRRLGHTLQPMFEGAAVQMLHRDSAGAWRAASDPRKGGAPAGEEPGHHF
jgi:gamma-glutamyltranspeptidase/glutathione hydrolase